MLCTMQISMSALKTMEDVITSAPTSLGALCAAVHQATYWQMMDSLALVSGLAMSVQSRGEKKQMEVTKPDNFDPNLNF